MATPTDLDPVLAELGARLRAALTTAGLPDTDPGFERPKDPSHGDWASTLSLRLAKPAKQNPRAIAQAVVDAVA
ncbi:MAG: arginyl-tRNA synthetase, partial [Nitriliruptoraceae bacterium]